MPLSIIPAYQKKTTPTQIHNNGMHIAELFSNTFQGEGVSIGTPATFLRLQGCVLNCSWCDTTAVWKQGNFYAFTEIFNLFEHFDIIPKLKSQHLVITGGSPLKQQQNIIDFILAFKKKYAFKPYIEIENECVLTPTQPLIRLVNQWNNSPKLANSTMRKPLRYKPLIIKQTALLKNSWFKFVISNQKDWTEIQNDFITPALIQKQQIILMPLANTKKQLENNRHTIANIALHHNVKFSDRLHITIFDQQTGV